MRKKFTIYNLRFTTLIVMLFVVGGGFGVAQDVLAQETDYKVLAPLPGTYDTNTGKAKASQYLDGLIKLAISAAAVAAVIMIIIAGFEYMTTDAFQGKTEARKKFANSFWGLLMVIASFVLLNTINPDLVNLNLSIPQVQRGGTLDTDLGTSTSSSPRIDQSGFFAGCDNCNIMSGYQFKIPGQGCALTNPTNGARVTSCLVNTDLNTKLATMGRNLESNGVDRRSWQVSEAFPPTRRHSNLCHNNGTCVDVSLFSPNEDKIKKFISESSKVGLRAVYEVETIEVKNALISSGVPSDKVAAPRIPICSINQRPTLTNGRYTPCCPSAREFNDPKNRTCSWITGNHFSVYLK